MLVCVHMLTHTHAYIHGCIYIYIYIYTYIYTYIHAYICIFLLRVWCRLSCPTTCSTTFEAPSDICVDALAGCSRDSSRLSRPSQNSFSGCVMLHHRDQCLLACSWLCLLPTCAALACVLGCVLTYVRSESNISCMHTYRVFHSVLILVLIVEFVASLCAGAELYHGASQRQRTACQVPGSSSSQVSFCLCVCLLLCSFVRSVPVLCGCTYTEGKRKERHVSVHEDMFLYTREKETHVFVH